VSCEGIVASIDAVDVLKREDVRMRWRKGLADTLGLAASRAEEEKDVRSLPGRLGTWLVEADVGILSDHQGRLHDRPVGE